MEKKEKDAAKAKSGMARLIELTSMLYIVARKA